MRFYDAIPIAVLSSCAAHAYVCILRAPVYVASYVTHRKLRTCLSAYLSVCPSVCTLLLLAVYRTETKMKRVPTTTLTLNARRRQQRRQRQCTVLS